MCSIGKLFFHAKVVHKQVGLKSLASFTYILLWKYCQTSVVTHLMISSTPRSEQSRGQSKTRNGREEQEQPLIFSCK